MSLTKKAQELADAIKATDEYKDLKGAESRLQLDPTAQDLVNDFQQKQQSLMEAQQSGQELDQQTIMELQGLQGRMQQNETIKNLMNAQQRFDVLMKDVNQTLATALV